jgi:hypothetical protein
MLARPAAAAAVGCRSCQRSILRAVLSSAAPAHRSLLLQTSNAARAPIALSQRAFSSERHASEPVVPDDAPKAQSKGDAQEALENEVLEDTPWFLEIDPPRHVPVDHKPELPTIPEDAPAMLEPMLKYVYEDMGLDDLGILDLRELDPAAALGPNLIMLFGTARSERHLHVSSGRFVRWLRRNHKVSAKADGLIGPGELKTKLRRLRKKAKLMGTNTAMIPGGDNGISTGWICVNFSTGGSDAGEAVSFDDSGRFSGFGTTSTGTTIVVQCMTEARRSELDLESLWQSVLRKSLEQARKIDGEAAVNRSEMDALVARRVQLPKSFAPSPWDAMKAASRMHRGFSTMARQLQESRFSQNLPPQGSIEEVPQDSVEEAPQQASLAQWRAQIENIQL